MFKVFKEFAELTLILVLLFSLGIWCYDPEIEIRDAVKQGFECVSWIAIAFIFIARKMS